MLIKGANYASSQITQQYPAAMLTTFSIPQFDLSGTDIHEIVTTNTLRMIIASQRAYLFKIHTHRRTPSDASSQRQGFENNNV